MKILIMLSIALVSTFAAYGQNDETSCPTVTNNKTRISKVAEFNADLNKDFTCHIATIKGSITVLPYDEDTSDIVFGLVIQSSDGSRETIYFIDDQYLNCFSEADKGNWKAQLIKGAKVIVKAYACGAGGKGDLALSSIEFLPKIRSKMIKK